MENADEQNKSIAWALRVLLALVALRAVTVGPHALY